MTRSLLFVDTHCNIPNILQKLKLPPSPQSFQDFRKKSFPDNFDGCISVASDLESRPYTVELMKSVDCIWGAFGIHPLYAEQYTEKSEEELLRILPHSKCVALGEIGLDYHVFEGVTYAEKPLQKKIFISQMQHAVKHLKPIIIHTREAEEDTLSLMKTHIPREWKLHVHCFTDSLTFAQKLMDEFPNLYFGFTGVITFKKSEELQKVAQSIPLERLLLETVPHRGKTCHPGHIPFIAEKIAELKQIPVEELYAHCRKNTKEMYGV